VAATSLDLPAWADRGNPPGINLWSRGAWPRIPFPVLVAVLLVAVLGAASARIAYAATYQPLSFGGGSYGPFNGSGLKPLNDGFGTSRWVVVAKPGAMATFMYAIENDGDDPVTIYDVPDSPDDFIYTSMAWTPLEQFEPDSTPHRLPVVVRPHQTIELLLSIRVPECAKDSGSYEINSLTIHSRAFGFSHTISLPLYGNTVEPIVSCAHLSSPPPL